MKLSPLANQYLNIPLMRIMNIMMHYSKKIEHNFKQLRQLELFQKKQKSISEKEEATSIASSTKITTRTADARKKNEYTNIKN